MLLGDGSPSFPEAGKLDKVLILLTPGGVVGHLVSMVIERNQINNSLV